jgi:hypothetical protein
VQNLKTPEEYFQPSPTNRLIYICILLTPTQPTSVQRISAPPGRDFLSFTNARRFLAHKHFLRIHFDHHDQETRKNVIKKNCFFHCAFAEWMTFDICGLTVTLTETKAKPSHLTTNFFEHYYRRLIGVVAYKLVR